MSQHPTNHRHGCRLCGVELVYANESVSLPCSICDVTVPTQVACAQGHFVCDLCHGAEARAAILRICTHSRETDMLTLLDRLRSLPSVPMNGPEHHAIVPATIITTYGNLGGTFSDSALEQVVDRGLKVPGGFCGFAGACGAAVGVGVAFARLLGSTPTKATLRQISMKVTQHVLSELSKQPGARCCRRDSVLALRAACDLSRDYLTVQLRAEADIVCQQWQTNKPCSRETCPMRRV